MVSLLTYPVKLLALLGSPSCRPLPPPLLRWSRELLASSGLLCRSRTVVVHSDVWLMKIMISSWSGLVQLKRKKTSILVSRGKVYFLFVI